MTLQFVQADQIPPTQNIFLYADSGQGKTTGALSGPGPVLYVRAGERVTATRFARALYGNDHVRETWMESPLLPGANPDHMPSKVMDGVYRHFTSGEATEQTLVIDSMGELFRLLMEEVTGGGKSTLPQIGDAQTKIERFARSLCDLPVNVVFIAHEISVQDEASGMFERLPFMGTKNPTLGMKLMAMVDIVGYCARLEAEQQGQPDQYVAQLVTANGRRGKDGSGVLGKFRPVDLTEWISLATQALDQQASTPTSPVALDAAAPTIPAPEALAA